MKYDTSLYMFALMPPDKLYSKLHAIREKFFLLFKCKEALKPPVHITLFDPFPIPIELTQAFEQYIAQIQRWAGFQSPFRIDLRDYNFFNNPERPVVYVDVIKSESMKKFYSGFMDTLTKYKLTNSKARTFKPHVTIGYRDVTPDVFPKIKDYYSKQTFSSSFICHTFYLWKHDGKRWQVVKTFFLDGKGEQLTLF